MELHFGYNCKHYLPTMKKCRVLIRNYRDRKDLVEQRWLTGEEMFVCLDLSEEALLDHISKGDIGVKIQKNGIIKYFVSGAWQFDDCGLQYAGMCLYYESHEGPFISCLKDITELEMKHPNLKTLPEEEINNFETQVKNIINLKIESNENLFDKKTAPPPMIDRDGGTE